MPDGFTYENITDRYLTGHALLSDGETSIHVSIAGPIAGKGFCARLWAENPFVDDSLNPSVYLGEFSTLAAARTACEAALVKVSGVRRPMPAPAPAR